MKSHQPLSSGELHLDSSSALTWFAPAAARLRVVRGSAWITRSGVSDDIVLRAGETLRVAAGDRLTVGSLFHGMAADLSWQLEAAAPSALQRLADATQVRAAALARRAHEAVRRLSLTEVEIQSV